MWVLVELCKCGFWLSVASVSFGAVKARLYDAPGAIKVTVAEETLAPSQWSSCKKQKAKSKKPKGPPKSQ